MTIPRRQQISLDHTRYYHCMSRCVRRAFLCGNDKFAGKSFEHRRGWIEDRLKHLASVFAIDLVAYAVMHNHYHVVLRVADQRAASWPDEEVAIRWSQIFSLPQRDLQENELRIWRDRLSSISWFMRCINEPLARRANREDDCSGRFWEGRFKLQALLDENALLKCMTYVDLNPVRSGVVRSPDAALHTSFKARLEGDDAHLIAFSDSPQLIPEPIRITRHEYVNLVHWSSRCIRSGTSSRLPANCRPVLKRMQLSKDQWGREIAHYGRWYYRAVGSLNLLEKYCTQVGQHWLKGSGRARSSSAETSCVHS